MTVKIGTKLPKHEQNSLGAILVDLGWRVAAAVLNFLFGSPPPPGTTCPDFIPQWVLDEAREWLW